MGTGAVGANGRQAWHYLPRLNCAYSWALVEDGEKTEMGLDLLMRKQQKCAIAVLNNKITMFLERKNAGEHCRQKNRYHVVTSCPISG